MNAKMRIPVTALLVALLCVSAALAFANEPTVTLNLKNATLREGLEALAREAPDFKYVLPKDVPGELSLGLTDVPLSTAMRLLVEGAGATYELKDGVYIIRPPEPPAPAAQPATANSATEQGSQPEVKELQPWGELPSGRQAPAGAGQGAESQAPGATTGAPAQATARGRSSRVRRWSAAESDAYGPGGYAPGPLGYGPYGGFDNGYYGNGWGWPLYGYGGLPGSRPFGNFARWGRTIGNGGYGNGPLGLGRYGNRGFGHPIGPRQPWYW